MRNYKKFTNEELAMLDKTFKTSSFYPDREKMTKLARSLRTTPSKIDNWFKYKRRKMYYCGKFTQYKIRKIFSKRENDFLNILFTSYQKPTYQKCKEISSQLPGISTYQVKNWFSNRRRKLRNDLNRSPSKTLPKFRPFKPTKPGSKQVKSKPKKTKRAPMEKDKKKQEPEQEIKSVKIEATQLNTEKSKVSQPMKVEEPQREKPTIPMVAPPKKEVLSQFNENLTPQGGQVMWPGNQGMNFQRYIIF